MLEWSDSLTRFCYFASPGLGKTAVLLKVLDKWFTEGTSKGALLIGPLRVSRITHPDQVAFWDHSSWMRVADMSTEEGAQAWEDGSADIYCINYDRLATIEATRKCVNCKAKGCAKCDKGYSTKKHPGFAERFLKGRKTLPVDTVVWDEISLCKDPSGKRANAVRAYNHLLPNRIGLTGTPVPNSYLDLFAQIRLIDDGQRLGHSFHAYRQRYFESDYMGFKWTLRPGAKETIDEKIADLCLVMLGDDYLDIPVCESIDVDVALPAAGLKAYKQMEKELLIELAKSDVVALNAAVLAGKLVQITSGSVYDENRDEQIIHTAKIDALVKLRKKIGDEPVLVLTQYKHENRRILEALPEAQMFDDRNRADWIAGRIKTWVANPASLSHGLDFLQHGGRTAIWFTEPWSSDRKIQTNARLVRTGQSRETKIYRLICRDTIDEAKAESLRNKSDEQSGLLNALKALQKLRK
jgi:SNF2-related domain